MLSANLTSNQRKAIYRRDGWRCALCDSTKYIQIHHIIPRGQGGTNHPHNLICLCADCHALAHGINLNDWPATQEDVEQAIVEYLSDLYAEEVWNPYRRDDQRSLDKMSGADLMPSQVFHVSGIFQGICRGSSEVFTGPGAVQHR